MFLIGDRPQLHDFLHRLKLPVSRLQLLGPLHDPAQAPHQPLGQLDLFIERNAGRNQRGRDDDAGQIVRVSDAGQKQAVEPCPVHAAERFS